MGENALTLLLPTIFDWIEERMNWSNDVQWNQQNDEWDLWSIKVGAAKICNKLNHAKITFNQKTTALTLILTTVLDWIDKGMNDGDAVWRWVHRKNSWVESYENYIQFICNKITMLKCMKNMNDCLFIFWWSKSEIQFMNKKQVRTNLMIKNWDPINKSKNKYKWL